MMFGLLIVSALLVVSHGKCRVKNCSDDPLLNFYSEVGCVPQKKIGNKCPASFTCPDFTSYNRSQCYVNNIAYNHGEYLRSGDVPLCAGECICAGEKKQSNFQCAIMDCARPIEPDDESCVIQQHLNQCCPSSNFICGEEAENLPTCTLSGKTYRQGEIMYSSHGCYKCLCDQTFDNSTAFQFNQNCIRINCGIQFNNMQTLEDGCAPIFNYQNGCCPIDYRCPNSTDYIISSGKRKVMKQATCKFGSLTLRRMDKLNKSNKCVSCECTYPPMVQCVQQSGCV